MHMPLIPDKPSPIRVAALFAAWAALTAVALLWAWRAHGGSPEPVAEQLGRNVLAVLSGLTLLLLYATHQRFKS